MVGMLSASFEHDLADDGLDALELTAVTVTSELLDD